MIGVIEEGLQLVEPFRQKAETRRREAAMRALD